MGEEEEEDHQNHSQEHQNHLQDHQNHPNKQPPCGGLLICMVLMVLEVILVVLGLRGLLATSRKNKVARCSPPEELQYF